MRKAINENPIVQIGLLAGLALVVALIFLSRSGGSAPPTEDAATTDPATTATTGAVPADPSAPIDPMAPVAPEAVTPLAPAGASFEASKGLPAEIVKSHESGDVVVLLIMQDKGIEDKSLQSDVEKLEADGGTSVFVTDVKNVAKYSRIAEGVTLDRVPAIIVLHPLEGKPAKDGAATSLPEASVTYGYRGPQSVRQTVEDVLYDGKHRAYDPG